jgi:hypothetical protein
LESPNSTVGKTPRNRGRWIGRVVVLQDEAVEPILLSGGDPAKTLAEAANPVATAAV